MATLLYEIGTEEMPAQYMPGILKTIRNWQKQNSRKPVFLLKSQRLRNAAPHGLCG